MCQPGISPILTVDSAGLGHYDIKAYFWALGAFIKRYSVTLHWSCWTHSQLPALASTWFLPNPTNWGQPPGGHPAMIHAPSVEKASLFACMSLGKSHRLKSSLYCPWRDRHLIPWHLAGQSDLKIIGHLMVHRSITVYRDVRQKPVHSVEQKGFQICGWSLPAPCKVPHKGEVTRRKAKTMPGSREERAAKIITIYATPSSFYICQIWCHPTTLLFLPGNPCNCHPSWPLRETAVSLQWAAPVYLQSRKPEVPSGPVGWRITWLFGRTGSDGCCELKRNGLKRERRRINYMRFLSINTFCSPTIVDFVVFAIILSLPVLTWTVLRCFIWRSTT